MIAPNIDIPPGLESAYYAVVRAMSGLNADAIGVQAYVAQKRSYKSFAQQSYFVLFNGVYDALSDARKTAWTAYWLTLPFGTHAGANGYPGSGFSAFIYVNAPRYKSGLDFLLDPPASDNLITNGNFNAGSTGWYTENTIITDKATFGAGPTYGLLQSATPFELPGAGTYRVSAKLSGTLSHVVFGLAGGGVSEGFGSYNITGAPGVYTFDFYLNPSETYIFQAFPQPSSGIVSIDDISLIKL